MERITNFFLGLLKFFAYTVLFVLFIIVVIVANTLFTR